MLRALFLATSMLRDGKSGFKSRGGYGHKKLFTNFFVVDLTGGCGGSG
jgi:hypothetical protein